MDPERPRLLPGRAVNLRAMGGKLFAGPVHGPGELRNLAAAVGPRNGLVCCVRARQVPSLARGSLIFLHRFLYLPSKGPLSAESPWAA